MLRIEDARLFKNHMVCAARKVSERKWEEFGPRLISAIVGSRAPYICQRDLYSWSVALEQFENSVRAWCQLRSVTHSDLVFDRTPLEESNADVNCVDDNQRYRPSKHSPRLGVIFGIGFLISGFIVCIRIRDDICDDRIGLTHIIGITFCLSTFIVGQLLLIWNLARLIGEKG